MSEHCQISGMIEHFHTAQQIFCYCRRCKRENRKLIINLDQGFGSVSIEAVCPKCKKVIWHTSVDTFMNESNQKEDMGFIYPIDDEKCAVCKKPTNHYDCYLYGGKVSERKMGYWCSKKCSDIQEKQDRKKWEKKN